MIQTIFNNIYIFILFWKLNFLGDSLGANCQFKLFRDENLAQLVILTVTIKNIFTAVFVTKIRCMASILTQVWEKYNFLQILKITNCSGVMVKYIFDFMTKIYGKSKILYFCNGCWFLKLIFLIKYSKQSFSLE